MDLESIKRGLLSLKGFPQKIGIIGGEPTLHPEFKRICKLIQKLIQPWKIDLFTTGGKRYEKYKGLIQDTFGFVAYNEHSEKQVSICLHQPITVAIQDVIDDEDLKNELIDKCWVQERWCPTINHKGAFFCEVAAAIDNLLDGPGGWKPEDYWWNKDPIDFKEQIDRYCGHCGMPIPLQREIVGSPKLRFSRANLELFRQHGLRRVSDLDVVIFDGKLTKVEVEENRIGWEPWNYRQDLE